MRRRMVGALLVGVALASLVGCSGDDDSADATKLTQAGNLPTTTESGPIDGSARDYTDAIAVVIMAQAGFESVSKADARCAAGGVVEAVGVTKLHQLGLSAQTIADSKQLPNLQGSLTDAQATSVANALLDCIDFGRVIANQVEAGSQSGFTATDAQVRCINDKVENNPDVRKAIASAYTGATNAPAVDILGLAAACLPADALANPTTTT
jgi:hypothetical protein